MEQRQHNTVHEPGLAEMQIDNWIWIIIYHNLSQFNKSLYLNTQISSVLNH